MSNLQESVVSAEGSNYEGRDSTEDRTEEIHLQAAGDTDVSNSIHNTTADTENLNRRGETHEQPFFHLANAAPTFEQVDNKVWSLKVNLRGLRWERETRGPTQCIRCEVPLTEALYVGSKTRATPIINGPNFMTVGQVKDPVARGAPKPLPTVARSVGLSLQTPSTQIDINRTIRYSKPKRNRHSNTTRYYVVLGIFSKADNLPRERIVFFTNPKRLFRYFFWAIVRLRGFAGLFSLKGVKGFAIYKCNWETGAHKRLKLDEKGVADMKLLLWAYETWPSADRVGEGWTQWIHETLNNHSEFPRTSPPEMAMSIEVILGWSAFRISIVVLLPVLLSLAIGCWLNSRDWNDLGTIQTAWGVASYIATAGALVAALLALVSNITD